MLRHVLLLCALGAALLTGCSGGEDASADDPVLAPSSFKEVVTSELKKEGLAAEQGFGQEVHVEEGLNWIDVSLDDAFAEYRRDPARRAEIVAGLAREAQSRLEAGISGASFADVHRNVMPLLKPRFALRGLEDAPAETRLVAGLVVIYAVERENAFTVVTPADVKRWGGGLRRLHELALANLLRQTNAEEELLCEEQLCGWASGDGYDATRMIVPALRRQIERQYRGPAVYAVPMEDVFVALPLRLATRKNTERLLKTKIERDFTTADNPVSPELFVERGGELVVRAR